MIEAFRSAIQSAGLIPPDHIEPGKILRFAGIDKSPSNRAGWCLLFEDGEGGTFGDWSTGLQESWHVQRSKKQSPGERTAFNNRIRSARHQAELERQLEHVAASKNAAAIWNEATESAEHPYLTTKNVQAHGTRVKDGALIIPLRDAAGTLQSLQFINNGKKFLPGGRVAGCYFALGKPHGTICIAEGFATAATLHQATGHATAAAMSCGNLKAVAEALHAKFPLMTIIIAADNDIATTGNPGVTKAKEAAKAVGGKVVVPPIEGDFNDLAQASGIDAVRACLDRITITVPILYRRLSDVQAVPFNWLWHGRIAKGKVTMIAGDPGLGKSQISSSITAIVTTAGYWPVDKTKSEKGSVIILSAEDDAADTIKPRLLAAGADVSRCYILDAVLDGQSERFFNLATDLDRLGALLDRVADAALVIIDPVSAYLGGTDSHKNSDVRALLAPLGKLAADHQVAIVCVSHLNKAGGQNALSRVTGSLAFVAAARAAFVVTRDPDDDTRRLFLPAKNNIGPDSTGLAYHIETADAGGIETSRICWHADAVAVSADEAMQPMNEERGEREEAKEFLEKILHTGPVKASEIMADAKGAGISEKTLKRAKKDLKVLSVKRTFDGKWEWAFPEEGQPQQGHPPRQTVAPFDQGHVGRGFQPDKPAEVGQGGHSLETGPDDGEVF